MRYFLLLLVCQAVNADYNAAVRDYESKNYDKAFVEFKRLAELGDVDSQRNLAAMYARGESAAKDLVAAYGWAALAADQDKRNAENLKQLVAKKLTPSELSAAIQHEQTLRARHGKQALNAELMPIEYEQAADCSVDVAEDAKAIETVMPRYPMEAAKQGVEAVVHVRFYLTASGETARAKVTKIEPNDLPVSGALRREFTKSVMSAITKWRFQPAAGEGLREVPREYRIAFNILTGNSAALRVPEEDPEVIAQAIDADDTLRMYQIALYLKQNFGSQSIQVTGQRVRRSDNDSKVDKAQARFAEERCRQQKLLSLSDRLFLRTAINGHSDGEYHVATRLLTGERCEKDQAKGLRWLSLSAQKGQPDAQYLLSHRLAAGDGVAQDSKKSMYWLQSAAESGHVRAGVEFAMQLLRQDGEDTELALKFLPTETDEDDIGVLEVKALASALNGQFTQASAFQKKVVAIAEELGFAMEQRQQWLASFQAGQLPMLAQ